MKKMKLLAVIFVSFMIAFGAMGCDEQGTLGGKSTDEVIEEYHKKWEQSTEEHFKLTDEFIKCLYEEDSDHFDRLYDIQDEIDDQVFNLIHVIGTLKNEESQRIVGSMDNAYMSTAPEITDDQIIFPMMATFRTDRKTRYNIDVMLYVNLESGKKPSMEKYGTDYKFNIDCRYEKEGADSDNYCSLDEVIYHTLLGNVIANEKLFADTKVWSMQTGIIEEKASNNVNNKSEYALEMPEADPIESQPDGDYDYNDPMYDEDSRVVSDTTTEPVDPEANLPADLKADLTMLRAMGYKPTGSGYDWRCEITGYHGTYATLQWNAIGNYWWAYQAKGIYKNSYGSTKIAYASKTLCSSDLINFYDVAPGVTNRSASIYFMLTRDGMYAIEF